MSAKESESLLSTNPWPRDIAEKARQFFEPQLQDLDLSEEQITNQNLEELQDSLERVNDVLQNPELFGILRLKATANLSILVSAGTESHTEIGVLPILLQRKKLIRERIRELKGRREILSLGDLVDSVNDENLRERLLTELEAMRSRKSSDNGEIKIREGYAFIAMSMDPNDPQLDDVIDAIKAGAEASGVEAERIDENLSNEPITDRMLDSIIESEFVIVDLTQSRPNVYYEAGFAQGLGKTPIYVAKAGTPIHFDLKDYPVIFYPNMRTLRESLFERLQAINVARK